MRLVFVMDVVFIMSFRNEESKFEQLTGEGVSVLIGTDKISILVISCDRQFNENAINRLNKMLNFIFDSL